MANVSNDTQAVMNIHRNSVSHPNSEQNQFISKAWTVPSVIPRSRKNRTIPAPRDQVLVRVSLSLLDAIDDWCAKQLDQPTRSEAFRRFAAQALMGKK
jgi:hypothetical protein